jgi:ADP-dependent NAD(P)H-hydrate dehydratase / NAD(P)H-hydrate epimerase
LVLAIVVALVLGAAGIGLFVVVPRWVEAKVLTTAEEQGVTLSPQNIGFGWGWVQITQVKVNLVKVRSVEMQVGRIDVTLDGMTAQSIELSNVDAVVTGSITNVGLELSEWTKAHPSAYALPLSAKNVHARFVEPADTPAWLELSEGQLSRTATGGVFAAPQARFLGIDLGKVGAVFAREASAIALGFGETDLSRAPFQVLVSPTLATPTAKFTMSPIAAERLAKPLGIPLPVTGVIVSSETLLQFPTGAAEGSVSGHTSINLKCYIPPHPFELDGFIFGDTTRFDTKFAMPALRDRITFTQSHLKAGSFELRGGGLLIRASDHSEATLTLKGELPCSALASVEAESRLSKILGSELSAKAGKLAQQLVAGSVAIGLKIGADTRNLSVAHIDRTIGVGCGLHPLSIAELTKLMPLPADVSALLQSLPTLPDLSGLPSLPGLANGVPALPSGLPALPQLPNLTFSKSPTADATAKPAPSASAQALPGTASKPAATAAASPGG